MVTLVGKIDRRLEPRDQIEQRGVDVADCARERALELLVGRVLARSERRGRTLRALAISARFVEGGTWRTRVTLRQASADSGRLRTALLPKLGELPAPAESIAIEVEAFGPPAHDQGRLVEDRSPAAIRHPPTRWA